MTDKTAKPYMTLPELPREHKKYLKKNIDTTGKYDSGYLIGGLDSNRHNQPQNPLFSKPETVKNTTVMTAKERRIWWNIHGTTLMDTEQEIFAQQLYKRGIIEPYDGIGEITYWRFTTNGAIAYFGTDKTDVMGLAFWSVLKLNVAKIIALWKRRDGSNENFNWEKTSPNIQEFYLEQAEDVVVEVVGEDEALRLGWRKPLKPEFLSTD